MRLLSSIFILLLIIIAISFTLLNSQLVTINYFFAVKDLPLSLILFLTLSAGCLLGFLVQLKILIEYRYRNYQLNKKNHLLNQEVNNLRALPVKDPV